MRAAAIRSRSATNCPARPSASAGRGDNTPRDQSRKSEEIVNYEISKTTKTEVIEGGRINRISVAVLVDGTYGKDDKGDVTYQPRSKEDLDQIGTLVRSAIGFDQKRGDQVQVVNLRFAETPAISIGEPTGWLSAFQLHQRRHYARHRIGGDGYPWTYRAAAGRAAAGAPHYYAGTARDPGPAAGLAARQRLGDRQRPPPEHARKSPWPAKARPPR